MFPTKIHSRAGTGRWATSPVAGSPSLRGYRVCVWPTWLAPIPLLSPFRPVKSREKISSRFYSIRRRRHISSSCSWRVISGVRWAPHHRSWIVIINLLPLQFHGFHRFVSNLFVGSLGGDELDEIYHVIELVLTGIDP